MCGCADTHTQSMWSILERDFEWKCLNVKLMKTLWLPAENTAMEYEQGIYIVKSYFKIFFPVLLYSAVHTRLISIENIHHNITYYLFCVDFKTYVYWSLKNIPYAKFRILKLSNSFYHLLEWTGFFGGSSGVIFF